MIFADKGNKVKQISEADIDKYVAQGFKIIDENGNLIQDAIPTDINILKTAYSESKALIKKLEAENAELKKEVEALNQALAKKAKSSETAKAPVQEVIQNPDALEETDAVKRTPKRQR